MGLRPAGSRADCHAGLDHQPSIPHLEHGMLGAASYRLDRDPGQPGGEAPACDAPEDVVVGEPGAKDSPPDKFGGEVADYGFDFGEFGHGPNVGAGGAPSAMDS